MGRIQSATPGMGAVAIFDENGTFLRMAAVDSRLAAPWGLTSSFARSRPRSQFRGAAVSGSTAMCYRYSKVANRSAVPASCLVVLGALSEGMGGFDYAACEACFEAKAHEGSLAGVGSRWDVFVTGGRRIRSNRRAGGGCTAVGYLSASNHSQ